MPSLNNPPQLEPKPPPTFFINFNYMEEFCNDVYEIFKIYKAKIKKFHENFILRKSLKIDQKDWLFIARLSLFLGKLKSNVFKIFDPGGS